MKLIPVVLMLLVVAGLFYFMTWPRRRTRRGDGSGGDAGSTACHGSRDAGSGHEASGSGDCGGDGGGGGD